MKAEIKYREYAECSPWQWIIKSNNGTVVAVGRYYTRKDNAKRGLRNFVEKMWTTVGIEKIMDSV